MTRIAGNQTDGPRAERDLYPTDPAWTNVLLDNITLPEGVMWEPAAGDGAIVDVLREYGYTNIKATDIDPQASGIRKVDFLTCAGHAPTIITNPPFGLFDEFVAHGLARADVLLVLLVGWHRLAGGTARAQRGGLRQAVSVQSRVGDLGSDPQN